MILFPLEKWFDGFVGMTELYQAQYNNDVAEGKNLDVAMQLDEQSRKTKERRECVANLLRELYLVK